MPLLNDEQFAFIFSHFNSLTAKEAVYRLYRTQFNLPEDVAKSHVDAMYTAVSTQSGEDTPARVPHARREQMRSGGDVCFAKSMANCQFSAAVKMWDQLCKFDGLYAPTVIKEDSRASAYNDPERIRARIRELARLHPELVGHAPVEAADKPEGDSN